MLTVKNNLLPTFSRFFEDDWGPMFRWTPASFGNESTLPAVNIEETDNEFIVEMAAPGMKKEDFHVDFNNNILTVKAETSSETDEEENGRKFKRREFNYQSFQRSFNVARNLVEQAKVTANYEDGVLKIVLPKVEEAKIEPKRLIEVS